MKKYILLAVLTAIAVCGQAQTTQKPTITAKCPCSDSLAHWDYKKWVDKGLESIYSKDGETVITLDWMTNEVTYNGDVYKMQQIEVSAIEPKVTIDFNDMELVLKYNDRSQYIGHTLRERFSLK